MSIEAEAFPIYRMTFVVVRGELDGSSAPGLEEKVLPLLQDDSAPPLDLGAVSYMSSAGRRMLLPLYRQAASRHGRLAFAGLAGLAESIRDTMEVAGFLKFFTVAKNVDAALTAVRRV